MRTRLNWTAPISLAVVLLSLLMGCGSIDQSPQRPVVGPNGTKAATTVTYVSLLAPDADPLPLLASYDLTLVAYYQEGGMVVFASPNNRSSDVLEFAQNQSVETTQPNYPTSIDPVDQFVTFLEGLTFSEQEYVDQDMLDCLRLGKAHQVTTGAGVEVAMLDNGVELDHPHLMGHVRQTVDPDLAPMISSTEGPFWHGTHVAGIIRTVAPDASIIPLKVLGDDGQGTVGLLVHGLQEALRLGVDVVSMSLSVHGEDNSVIDVMLAKLDHAGITVVSAAGNTSSPETTPRYPSINASVLGVSASVTRPADCLSLAYFSRYDATLTSFAAPGVDIVSCVPAGSPNGASLAAASGTSMATAVAAGAAALGRAVPDRGRNGEVLPLLKSSAVPLPGLVYYGLIDLYAAYASGGGIK